MIIHPALMTYSLSSNIIAFSTLRNGAGVSMGSHGSMNINPYCGDNIQNVEANKIILSKILNIDPSRIILPHQTHGVNCKVVDNEFLNLLIEEHKACLEDTDALVTNLSGVCIGVSTADCVPILLYDERLKIGAAIHAGWRGTSNHIVCNTLDVMCSQFQCKSEDITAIIGPSISKKAFEVGQEVYDAFKQNGFSMPEISEKISGRWHIDLWMANTKDLLKKGLSYENIHTCGICTYYNYGNFFSARQLSVNSGRIYTGLIIR